MEEFDRLLLAFQIAVEEKILAFESDSPDRDPDALAYDVRQTRKALRDHVESCLR